ncbi:AN1-type zinc finger protein 2B isoform X1 [Phasianus colchicus]|uniref:AN1-type zinc finger protein 2B isoform X1 n=1 Tax=Phasianus colchicus TaxID=9054 RepID=UPI00129E248E|nr:AN1-type zinc finger protein 2B isoform X1 [Phasianus colchicus]
MKFTPGPVLRVFLPRPCRTSLELQAAKGPSSARLCPYSLGMAAGHRKTSKHLEEGWELCYTAAGQHFGSARRLGREAAVRPLLLGQGKEGDGVGGYISYHVAAGPARSTARAGHRVPPARLSGFAAVNTGGLPLSLGRAELRQLAFSGRSGTDGGSGAGGMRGARRAADGEAEDGRWRKEGGEEASSLRAPSAPRGRPVTAAGVVPAASPPRVTPGRKRARRGRPGEGPPWSSRTWGLTARGPPASAWISCPSSATPASGSSAPTTSRTPSTSAPPPTRRTCRCPCARCATRRCPCGGARCPTWWWESTSTATAGPTPRSASARSSPTSA